MKGNATDRTILHLDLDAFFCTVEVLRNCELKGKPLIIGGATDRGVVASASYEARHFGVRSAMPMSLALRLCPQAIVISGDSEIYLKYSTLVTQVVADKVPLFEKASIDEFYCDLTGMDRYIGCCRWAGELYQQIVKETGLSLSYAVSVNKLVAKVGSNQVKPQGSTYISSTEVVDFLSPLNVRKIPGVGTQTYQRLSSMGVRTVKVLQQIPVKRLEREFGEVLGVGLHEKSWGIDGSPVVAYREQKSISQEHTFTQDTTDMQQLRATLLRMTEKLCFELRQKGKVTSCVMVKLKYADFNTVSKQRKVLYCSHDPTLISLVHALFDQLYERRVLIRLVGVRFSGLVQGDHQIDLFQDATKLISLHQAMDRIRSRFGTNAITRAASF